MLYAEMPTGNVKYKTTRPHLRVTIQTVTSNAFFDDEHASCYIAHTLVCIIPAVVGGAGCDIAPGSRCLSRSDAEAVVQRGARDTQVHR